MNPSPAVPVSIEDRWRCDFPCHVGDPEESAGLAVLTDGLCAVGLLAPAGPLGPEAGYTREVTAVRPNPTSPAPDRLSRFGRPAAPGSTTDRPADDLGTVRTDEKDHGATTC